MRYEDETLIELLIDKGIDHNLNNRIKPSKHPNISKVMKVLKAMDINYTYFWETDTLVITQQDSILYQKCVLPSPSGISIVVIGYTDDVEAEIEMLCNKLDEILPMDLSYEILGVM
jgi:hypothetical protein